MLETGSLDSYINIDVHWFVGRWDFLPANSIPKDIARITVSLIYQKKTFSNYFVHKFVNHSNNRLFFICSLSLILIISLLRRISHFAQKCDIQTAAMLCCAFGRHCPSNAEISRSSSLSGKSLNGSVSYNSIENLLHISCTKDLILLFILFIISKRSNWFCDKLFHTTFVAFWNLFLVYWHLYIVVNSVECVCSIRHGFTDS